MVKAIIKAYSSEIALTFADICTSYAVITIAIRLRYDYDPTTTYRTRLLPIRRKQKMNVSIFRRSRIVVVSQSNRTHIIVISITSVVVERVVVSSYRSRIGVESQLSYRLKSIFAGG